MPNFIDTSAPHDCLFCNIVSGKIPAIKVHESRDVLAFMDIGPVNPGHLLVAPKAHSENIFDIPPETAREVMAVAQQLAIAVKQAFDCPGLMLFQANGREGEQTVFHFHMHVVPRYAEDGAGLIWPRHARLAEQLEEDARRIQSMYASRDRD
ncbi:HIT family protein [Herbaspirillum sp. NPDC087042]|uniref:HIT family protein n=1 Tax=Herbaspirillum sp. NPDC087042 TaxID=3364004 RepID=UPI00381E8D94